ncbi:unspecified product [Plasmodium ovale wallikeri]|uniref:Unspecified product n=1 Tax=Plasmodium ovale wallikeri TaxID=864142 RepID=A0A1A9A5Y8_PLAOA|nr:unspecified product [Plasmodium ovale wallikeri]
MKKFTHTCNEIKRATKRDTHNVYIRYKTPILQGAINIINEFSKDKNDGIHYKNLCEELNKYVIAQRKCVREEITNMGKNFVTKEWNIIRSALEVTFKSQKVNRLCYLDNDKEIDNKKYILNLHELFRNFCIEKKERLRNTSEVDFEKCNEYLSWIAEKKRELQSLDPDYKYIEEYKEYFHIHDNCNYPWLLQNAPDIICRRTTTTKAGEKGDKGKPLSDTSQKSPPLLPDNTADSKKKIPLERSNQSKGEAVLTRGTIRDTDHEKTPAKSTPSDHSQSDNNDAKANNQIMLKGTPVDDPPVSQPNADDKYTKFESWFYSFENNIDSHKVPHDVHDAFKKKLTTFRNKFLSVIQGEPIPRIITQAYKYISPKLLHSKIFLQSFRSQGFQPHLSKQQLVPRLPSAQSHPPTILDSQQFPKAIQHIISYVPTTKPMKKQLPLFRLLPAITTNPPDNNNIIKVEIEPAAPDPSYFRSPSMIYALVFLTLFTIITLFYLLSKYTSFGLYFGKKKRKRNA